MVGLGGGKAVGPGSVRGIVAFNGWQWARYT